VLTASVPEAGPGFDVLTRGVIDDLEALHPTRLLDRLLINGAIDALERSLDPALADNGFFLD
jgi:hypothetical protein